MVAVLRVLTLAFLALQIEAKEPESPHNSVEWQIWAYSSAAPSPLGSHATIVGSDNSVLREGSNGWTCMAGNPRPVPASGWNSAHEAMPMCTDSEGMKWITAFMAGKPANMDRDAFMWMLHGNVGEDNSTPGVLDIAVAKDPSQWIESGPHLMLLPKDPKSLDEFPVDFNIGEP